jgi:hypothetical protein
LMTGRGLRPGMQSWLPTLVRLWCESPEEVEVRERERERERAL